MQFDDFYKTVGTFGPYQKVKYLFIRLTYIIPPVMVYTWTFTVATHSFRCRIASDDLVHRYIPSGSQCREYQSKRCYQRINKTSSYNQTNRPLEACTDFIFNRTNYESTLVEEWSMVCNRALMKYFVQIMFFVGYMVGSLVFGILSDKFGRGPIMSISFAIITVAGFLCAFAPQQTFGIEISYGLFVFGRFLLASATRGIVLTRELF